MNIAIASGKGGTGKTTVAVNLALSMEGRGVGLLDCDVEEPDDGLFLDVAMDTSTAVARPRPVLDESRCTHCGKCAAFCNYHAIAVTPGKVLFFEQLCNGCGGCSLVCPEDAISEVDHTIGYIETGKAGNIGFVEGRLNTGEAKAVPLIDALKKEAVWDVNILDAPPGTSCPVLETVRETDICLLVTEPTPFGLHDLKLAVEAITSMEVPMGVIINRDGVGNDDVLHYCREEGLEIMMRIPFDTGIARSYSDGIPYTEHDPEARAAFRELFRRIEARVQGGDVL